MNRGALRPGAGGRLGGVLRLRVSGALPEAFLNECARRGVRTEQVEAEDEFTLALSVAARDAQAAEAAAARCGCTAERLRLRGAPAALRRLRRRLFLCLGALGAALLLFLSSLYIWDIEVTENDTAVPDGEILAALRQAGVDIGTFWPSLRGDMVRTRALLALPELSWLTVNVRGSRAEVLVRGAVAAPEIWEEKTAADVTAAKAGVITEIRVLEGEARASVGDAVLPGEVLASARRAWGQGGESRLVRARAEVTARTWYEITAAAPLEQTERRPSGRGHSRWGVIFGKRSMFFALRSSNPGASCDKITTVYPLAVKGAFTLPAALVRETLQPVERVSVPADEEALLRETETLLRERLEAAMAPGGEISSLHFSQSRGEGMLYVTLRAECLERIDRESPPEEN